MNALIVDDSPAMRAFIKRVLDMCGMELEPVFEAANGREALEILRSFPIDLALCDINMPEMSGEELLTVMAHEGLGLRTCVVIVSSDATDTRVERMLHLGAKGYLKKPFPPEALRETLDRALGVSHA